MDDSLTGLLNRETFDRQIIEAVDSASERSSELAMVFMDLDHFKRVNDTYGHQKGDDVLREVGSLLRRVIEGKGHVYRYGGEEIAIILPNSTIEEAIATAERIRRTIESSRPADLELTASFGIAVFPEHASDSGTLIRAADQALYDAKNKGRNLVRVYGEPEPPTESTRIPERREPTPGALTEEQKHHLYLSYFRGFRTTCPLDGALLEVIDVTGMGDRSRTLSIHCPVCGLDEVLLAQDR